MKSLVRPKPLTGTRIIQSLRLVDARANNNKGRNISSSSHLWRPTNVGGIGLAAKDATVGEQAPEPLTIEGIKARRLKAGKLVAGTAAYSDSDMFKSPVRTTSPIH
jgi:hypothetical protein